MTAPGAAADAMRPEDRLWIPVAPAAELADGVPLAALRIGAPVVLWRAPGGALAAFDDRCPHRGARLSLGRVDAAQGTLECPYHGWRFGADGRCVAIPALPAFTPPAGHRARTWRAAQAHGLLWLAGEGAPPAPPAFDGLPARTVLCGPYDVATSAPRLVENFLDTAHFGLVHEGWLGDRGHLVVPDYRVEHDAEGRPGVPRYRAWQPRASAAAEQGAWVDYRYRVVTPYAALLEKTADAPGGAPSEAYALWACPLEAERTRAWFTLFTSDGARGDAELRAFQDTIFRQDQPVVESQRPRTLPVAGGELHAAADRLSVAYRRWLRELGITFGVS